MRFILTAFDFRNIYRTKFPQSPSFQSRNHFTLQSAECKFLIFQILFILLTWMTYIWCYIHVVIKIMSKIPVFVAMLKFQLSHDILTMIRHFKVLSLLYLLKCVLVICTRIKSYIMVYIIYIYIWAMEPCIPQVLIYFKV